MPPEAETRPLRFRLPLEPLVLNWDYHFNPKTDERAASLQILLPVADDPDEPVLMDLPVTVDDIITDGDMTYWHWNGSEDFPTLHPSLRIFFHAAPAGKSLHFWIREGRVVWCKGSVRR